MFYVGKLYDMLIIYQQNSLKYSEVRVFKKKYFLISVAFILFNYNPKSQLLTKTIAT